MTVRSLPSLSSLLLAAGCATSFVEGRLATIGLSLPKLMALHRLVEAGEALPLGQLAERLACVKSNVTQLVDRLEADGLVTRTLDPTDRRSRLAAVTAAGLRAHDQGMRIHDDAERELFARLTGDDLARLFEILGKLEHGRS